jgi:23S rRNA pseudouridine2605 synthase
MILSGRVKVNGAVANLGDSADADLDEILVDGKPLPSQEGFVYIMLNKPRGYVTTLSDEKGRPNAAQLVADCGLRVYPIGRLDMDSEGLLLFTNDGEFANRLMHPRHEIEKTYDTWVTGFVPGREAQLRRPIMLDGYTIRPPKVQLISAEGTKAMLRITIHEGRNRQVRRMCQAAGMQVIRLRRISEGKLRLGNLEIGKWRYLTQKELEMLK